ncbi:RNA-directed DNA polymerase from mobile element jockey [Elysia marginata]|uniref:RNA-directed DNA polymerase from mobile element jockey n=1 Tax=Elysia marginata TaxID=1093978 RepID=A0AAV4EI90_9GAST|nr:RNA-directed DNA polymerase from mobile element jockey [Elysia marginata]
MKHGVPQGGILSPTLFSMFMNDIQTIVPKGVYGTMYADDMAIWATEEYTGTAQARLQLALDALRMWTEKWLMKINPEKTTFTTFTLSTKSQTVHLKIGDHQLREEQSPTYLGVTFDKRLTWKAQTDKCQERGILRTGLLRRLAGTQWGADMKVLKTVYTGYVRPVLEYGSSARNTTAKSNQQKVEKVQNQSLRIITEGLKSTPILKMETITGLQSLEERREIKILTQRQKYKAMPNCVLNRKLKDTNKGRLKRNSFCKYYRILESKNKELTGLDSLETVLHYSSVPPYEMHTLPKIVKEIENIGAKAQLSEREIMGFTNKHLDRKYPIGEWIRIYTDGSATDAVRNGGGGVYATLPDGTTLERSFACGRRCTKYKAETEAIKEALNMVNNKISKTSKVVILSDARSVLQTLENTKDTELDTVTVRKKLLDLMARVGELTLQWIP